MEHGAEVKHIENEPKYIEKSARYAGYSSEKSKNF
jgi:hypothetical protein